METAETRRLKNCRLDGLPLSAEARTRHVHRCHRQLWQTTTKEMVAAVLASQYTGHNNLGGDNNLGEMIRPVLLTRRRYQFCVQEINIARMRKAVPLEKRLKMFRPQIGVVTTIGTIISAHTAVEAIAAEKGKLIAARLNNGTAILNADDPLVLAMRSQCQGRILTYGLSPDASCEQKISGTIGLTGYP